MNPKERTTEVNWFREATPIHHRYTVRLAGEQARGARIASSVLGELTDLLLDATRGALRQRVEGRSTAPGRVPVWLHRAATFDVVGLEPGSTVPSSPSKTRISLIGRLRWMKRSDCLSAT